MAAVALHTHWVPAYWRGNAHTRSVRTEFQGLFQLRLVLFAEEAASVLLLPWICGVSLPRCASDISRFLHRVRPAHPARLLPFRSTTPFHWHD